MSLVQFALRQGSPAAAIVPLLLIEHEMMTKSPNKSATSPTNGTTWSGSSKGIARTVREACSQARQTLWELQALQHSLNADLESEAGEEQHSQ
jgi:hypothetical protein